LGAVYQARQTSLDRLVVIKLVPLAISADAAFAERFRKEARAMARLSHPNIVGTHDFGTTSAGHLFIVMDYVEGPTLHDIIHRPAEAVAGITDPGYFLAPDQALAFVEQVCAALGYAHARGIVHRGLKPAKVMIDTEGQVRVTDFGLSPPDGVADRPGYPAPEQARGSGADRRTDIYRLGVMLYEMLCREVPAKVFVPPSKRIGCEARIDALVRQAIQQAPERRYQSIQEMQGAVAAARAPLPAPLPQMTAAPLPVAPAKSKLTSYTMLIVVAAGLALAYAHFTRPNGKTGLAAGKISPRNPSDGSGATSSDSGAKTGVNVVNDAETTGDQSIGKTTGRTMEDADDKALAAGEAALPTDSPSSPQPKNAVEKWLADVDGPRQAMFQKLVAEPFTAGVEKLRTRYLAALDAAQAKAAATGSLAQALIWVNERELFEKAQTVWPDDAGTPAAIRPLRADYRQRLAQLESERANRVKPLYTSYDAILLQNLTLLTQRGRIADALLLKNKRDELAKIWLATPVTGHLPAVPTEPEPGPAPEELAALAESSAENPEDNLLSLRVAALQAWFGRNANHAATCERAIEIAERSNIASDAGERAAKSWCLTPSRDPAMLKRVLALAREAATNESHDFQRPWYQQTLGMAEFRAGNDEAADAAFRRAEEAAEIDNWQPKARPFVQGPARFFRAMILFRKGKRVEAETLFHETEAQMRPLPTDEAELWFDNRIQDPLIVWLAFKEAKALLEPMK
ncbi:MAG: serine/threonine-protein kinase, partial [Chthoniobacteraceae bacterium]